MIYCLADRLFCYLVCLQVLMEADYKPSGWLGALMGTRLYFNMSDPRQIPSKMGALIKELGDAGRWVRKQEADGEGAEAVEEGVAGKEPGSCWEVGQEAGGETGRRQMPLEMGRS